jgi:hypothetical protein
LVYVTIPRCVACVNGTAWAPPLGTDIARIVVYSDEKSLIYTLLPEKTSDGSSGYNRGFSNPRKPEVSSK